MFVPPAPENAVKAIETIPEVKEKNSASPFEADLLQMAEMIAEDEKDKEPSRGGTWLFSIPRCQLCSHHFTGDWSFCLLLSLPIGQAE